MQYYNHNFPVLTKYGNDCQSVTHGRKRERNNENTDYWLGEAVPTTNKYSTLSEEEMASAAERNSNTTEPKPPPIFITRVKNIKHLTAILDEIANQKYTIKTLSNDQVKAQP
jgi:hypothetical protein